MAKRNQLTDPQNILLWTKAGGRCEFMGCNKILYRDKFFPHIEYNIADKAHIVANSPKGPRGHNVSSKKLNAKISNLMLLCKDCHKRIDANVKFYTVLKLRDMKRQHEKRIERVTGIIEDNRTELIIYSANIGSQSNHINENMAENAVIANNMYPMEFIDLSHYGSMSEDREKLFWQTEPVNLEKNFNMKVRDRIAYKTGSQHFSVFALAPIPLLIKLGSLLTDKTTSQVYQKFREPDTWSWQEDSPELKFSVSRPQKNYCRIALILSMSASIPSTDIYKALGKDTSVWKISVEKPYNDCIRNKNHLSAFRKTLRTVLLEIKNKHGAGAIINIFPAIPVSIAIEIGRVWMPKADLPLIIYDRNREDNLSFIKRLTIGVENE